MSILIGCRLSVTNIPITNTLVIKMAKKAMDKQNNVK